MAGFCRQLHAVSLSGLAAITDKSILRLVASCPGLLMLDVFGTSITDASLVAISSHCSEIQYLNIGMCSKVTARGVHAIISSCANLYDLDVAGLPVIDGSLRLLPQTNPQLKRLNISRCTQLSPFSISSLASLSLTLLRVRGMRSLTAIELHSVLLSSPALETLDVTLCAVGYSLLVFIAKFCPFIRRLYVDCTQVDNESITHFIASTHTTLEHLSVIGTKVTVECVEEIQSRYRKLTVAGPQGDEFDLPWI